MYIGRQLEKRVVTAIKEKYRGIQGIVEYGHTAQTIRTTAKEYLKADSLNIGELYVMVSTMLIRFKVDKSHRWCALDVRRDKDSQDKLTVHTKPTISMELQDRLNVYWKTTWKESGSCNQREVQGLNNGEWKTTMWPNSIDGTRQTCDETAIRKTNSWFILNLQYLRSCRTD